jgi:hypothetical protein
MVIIHLVVFALFISILVTMCFLPGFKRTYKQTVGARKLKSDEIKSIAESTVAAENLKSSRSKWRVALANKFKVFQNKIKGDGATQFEACPSTCGKEALWDADIAPFHYCTKCANDGDCGVFCEPYSYGGENMGNCGCINGQCRLKNNPMQRAGDASGWTASDTARIGRMAENDMQKIKEMYARWGPTSKVAASETNQFFEKLDKTCKYI